MNTRVEALLEEARKLTPDEREELLLRLQWADEPSEGTPAEIEEAWVAEVERASADRGETTFIEIDTALAKAEALLQRK